MYLNKEDNNKIMAQIKINYIFKVFRLVIIIFTISYFIGTLFYVFSNLVKESQPNFITKYELETLSDVDKYYS